MYLNVRHASPNTDILRFTLVARCNSCQFVHLISAGLTGPDYLSTTYRRLYWHMQPIRVLHDVYTFMYAHIPSIEC